jgi:hypothetical protein
MNNNNNKITIPDFLLPLYNITSTAINNITRIGVISYNLIQPIYSGVTQGLQKGGNIKKTRRYRSSKKRFTKKRLTKKRLTKKRLTKKKYIK